MHPTPNEIGVIAAALLAARFFTARCIARTAFKVYEIGLSLIPAGHPVRVYSHGRMRESRERALPLMRPTKR